MAEGVQLRSEDWAGLFDPDITCAAHRLRLDRSADVYDAADAIELLLDAVDDIDAVAIWTGDQFRGHTSRAYITRLYSVSEHSEDTHHRGLGDGDGMNLPGAVRFTALRFDCPECGLTYWLTGVVPGDPPTCDDDGRLLEYVR